MTAPIQTLAAVTEATGRLLGGVARMDPDQLYEPSTLPHWTRGHVLAHLCRSADALCNMLTSARTGQSIPMYASAEAREHDIEAGSKRPLDEQLTDLRASAQRFTTAAEAMPEEAWSEVVQHRLGSFPAFKAVHLRHAEIEYHHVDLALDYSPADWPADFVAYQLTELTHRYRDASGLRALLLHDTGTGTAYPLGGGTGEPLALRGSGAELVAWLSGRSDGSTLGLPAADLPTLPALA